MKPYRIAFLGTLQISGSFLIYGVGRTMCETVGFSGRAPISGFALASLLLIPILTAEFVAIRHSEQRALLARSALFILSSSLLFGCLVSELWILHDEKQFASEVSAILPQRIYSRPRAWPNGVCALVFVPGQGIHATD